MFERKALAEGEELGSNILHLGAMIPGPQTAMEGARPANTPVNLPDIRFTSDSYRAFAMQRNDAICQEETLLGAARSRLRPAGKLDLSHGKRSA
jgi:hypothetical protein